jgi:flagellar basal body rod protein FlgF
MVDMLSNARSYELSVKILTTAKDLDAETAKLMRSDR